MPSPSAVDIQMEFSGVGGGWTSVWGDVQAKAPVRWSYGIKGGGPNDHIAETGTLTFGLDNSNANSGSVQGYYSPDHASKRSGFAVGIRARFTLTYSAVTYYKFIGTLESVVPVPGQRGERITLCTVVDWMDEAAKQRMPNVATQIDRRADQIIATVVSGMARQPVSTSYAAAQLEYPFALDTAKDESTMALSEIAKAVVTDLGYLYMRGDVSAGGVLTYHDRRMRQSPGASLLTLNNEMSGMQVSNARTLIYNRIKVTIHPRRVDAVSNTVLYSFEAFNPIQIGPSESVTVIGTYRDPEQRAQRVGGVDLVTPVADVDYGFGAGPGDTSLTASLSVTASSGGNSVIFTLTNNGSQTGFVTLLQVRGRGLYDYEPITVQVEDATSKSTYGEYVLPLDLPHESRVSTAKSIADRFLSKFKDPRTAIESVTFKANRSATLLTAALAREPGDRITVQETVTGLNTDYFINGCDGELQAGQFVTMTWYLEPRLDTASYWIIGTSQLGTDTVLGW